MVMTNRNELRKAAKSPSQLAAAKAIDELRDSGALDSLFSKIDAGELQLTGEGGFVPGLIKAALEGGCRRRGRSHTSFVCAARNRPICRTDVHRVQQPLWANLHCGVPIRWIVAHIANHISRVEPLIRIIRSRP